LCSKIKQNKDIDLDRIVLNTPGYVGADLNALIDEALISSLDRRLDAQISGENSREEDASLVLNCKISVF
jgi:SpoVK/Ycf46/Vps4 family AAA+-type ATPase